MAVVACLGVKKAPERNAVKPRKALPETVLSRRGCLCARAKMSFSQSQTKVKMKTAERARRDKDVGIGITSNGVVVKRYEGLKFRDFSAKISSPTSP